MESTSTKRRGGEWLIGEDAPEAAFTPEHLSEEHRLIARTAAEFVAAEIVPALPELERKNWNVARSLLRRCGELGLLGADVPERFGGVGLDKAASVVINEAIGAVPGFATTFGAQSGLAIIPILCFGTDAQQEHYLPRILTGDLVGAYCLSESGSGSDALGARARAVPDADGSWRLSGEKMWTTNGGFADVFVVFAKAPNDAFTAFIVERGFPGVAIGKEEHKMGLESSSTTSVLLQDAQVPAGNLLGEVGRGHKIAFNVLNYGRFKLAAMCTGGASAALAEAAAYAATRRQFGQPIASFGAVRQKLAEMTIRLYGVESMLYRTTGFIDRAVAGNSHDAAVVAAVLEEFAVECSLVKVAGSEMIDYVVDENVQIHGGNGFVRDYPAERRYRDARVNRIFEGTNEINRLLVPTMLAKRAQKGGLPVADAARAVRADLLPSAPGPALPDPAAGAGRTVAGRTVAGLKRTALLVLGLAMEAYGERFPQEQETLTLVSDIMLDAFAAESAVLRAAQAEQSHHPLAGLHADAAAVLTHDAGLRADAAARTALAAMVSGDTLRTLLAALPRVLGVRPVDTIAARRRIADRVSREKQYIFR